MRSLNDLMYRYFLKQDSSEGGGGSEVTVANFPASQAVTGPLTNTQQLAIVGAASNTPWDGVAASATAISILKSIRIQNAQMIQLLTDIKTNTTPTP